MKIKDIGVISLNVFFIFAAVFLITGCRNNSESQLAIEELILPYYCYGVVKAPQGVTITYLPENSGDSHKLTVRFNKALSEKNTMNLYYIQTGSPVPILSMEKTMPSGKRYDQYQISGNNLEIGYNGMEKGNYYVNPMTFSALYFPEEIMAEDGSVLETDLSVYFSMGAVNPHEQFEQINVVMNETLTPTLIIPTNAEQGSAWNSSGQKNREVGYVRETYSPIYSSKEMSEVVDRISFGANVELAEAGDGYYRVHYYVPRDASDEKHHSRYALSNDLDIFESEYLIKKQGYVKAAEVGLIGSFDNPGAKVSVYATGTQTMNGTLELYVSNLFYPGVGSSYRLYNVMEDTEIRSDEVIRTINDQQINALEVESYLYLNDLYGSGVRIYNDENNKSLPMEDKRNHLLLLNEFKDDQAYIMRLRDEYNGYLFESWNRSVSDYGKNRKADFDKYFASIKKMNDIWYEWSQTDPEVKRETYIKLVVDNLAATEDEKRNMAAYFADSSEPLFNSWTKFVEGGLGTMVDRAKIENELKRIFGDDQ
ncbi:hypothetical protein [Paenibacillus eucommiae]|uniref:Uncharacterized protein n=1 Tax=Paenibacillus eucommiae TaxID=1355755 RepID=A0ABS4J4N7_9BACL|nr:hypothetical protein [Paenibacillus eucommiae]MBP1993749.1 hypothetical protein [Paenibacillus eucommiae]